MPPTTPAPHNPKDQRPRATMTDVASLAGVALKTVSRVVNGEPNVSSRTAERVWSAVEELDYHVDMRAGSLRRTDGRTKTVGLLVSSVANPFAGELHRGVEEVAAHRSVAVIAASLEEDPARERALLRDFRARHVDGIVLDTTSNDPRHVEDLCAAGIAVVLVDRVPEGPRVDSVTSDNLRAAEDATLHLLAHGHRRIALVMEPRCVPTAAARLTGFHDALRAANIDPAICPVIEVPADAASARRAVEGLLRSPERPTALFSTQNVLSVGVVGAIHATGHQHDVAFVGFDDVPLAEFLDPPLTLVHQDPRLIGRLAAELLFDRLDGASTDPRALVVPTRMVARGSGEIRPAH
ncbi:LacI family DNA-binding transcriptional regulator [Schaalia sp. 19OD2882]|uniref:LacI family DNA-binding transcriptional regulator n=1 Tax=Schaalia sp. 19OD2882 TaxID=2794089 RepID=UPI001C1F144D|nr:LacI family DNA-binding transcriptional regulator [Schaalia sp. 19OD2882]QWW18803.1 LacI family DNA-binding transcriptional regulator [Schaalia sp. 19OD2882]